MADINANPALVESAELARGPHSKYTLPDQNAKARLEFKWVTNPENGVACKLDSKGYAAIIKATERVLGSASPYSIGGSLPLIRELQDSGFDVQISGYGISAR